MELSLQMGFVQVSREILARTPGTVQEAKYGPQRKEHEDSQWEAEEEPFGEGDGVSVRVIALPHPDQYEIDTCPGEGANPSDGGCVYDPENHGAAELLDGFGLGGTHREALENAGGDGHHDHGGCHVVHPHADEGRRGAYPQEEQRRVHWVPTE